MPIVSFEVPNVEKSDGSWVFNSKASSHRAPANIKLHHLPSFAQVSPGPVAVKTHLQLHHLVAAEGATLILMLKKDPILCHLLDLFQKLHIVAPIYFQHSSKTWRSLLQPLLEEAWFKSTNHIVWRKQTWRHWTKGLGGSLKTQPWPLKHFPWFDFWIYLRRLTIININVLETWVGHSGCCFEQLRLVSTQFVSSCGFIAHQIHAHPLLHLVEANICVKHIASANSQGFLQYQNYIWPKTLQKTCNCYHFTLI